MILNSANSSMHTYASKSYIQHSQFIFLPETDCCDIFLWFCQLLQDNTESVPKIAISASLYNPYGSYPIIWRYANGNVQVIKFYFC